MLGKLKFKAEASGKGCKPKIMAKIVTVKMPMTMAALTRLMIKSEEINSPIAAKMDLGSPMLPNRTKVAGSCTIQPQPFKPIKAINKPIPTTMACFKSGGTESMMACLRREIVKSRKTTPEINTHPRPVCQV